MMIKFKREEAKHRTSLIQRLFVEGGVNVEQAENVTNYVIVSTMHNCGSNKISTTMLFCARHSNHEGGRLER
jgi:LDH2 family malate/lactate/ureidoglycolate dehydrogenase